MPDSSTSVGAETDLRPSFRVRVSRPTVTPLIHVDGHLAGENRDRAFETARREIVKWLGGRSRLGSLLPRERIDALDFEVDEPGFRCATASIDADYGRVLAVRFDHHGTEHAGTWSTEIVLASRERLAVAGVRLSFSSHDAPPVPEIPGIVRQLVERPGLVRRSALLQAEPNFVTDRDALDELIAFINDPSRRLPVIAISLPAESADAGDAVVDAFALARRSLGVAHVAVLPGDACFALSDKIGRRLSVFRRAIRVYAPGKTLDSGPFAHPLYLPDRVEEWNAEGPTAFETFLHRHAAASSVSAESGVADIPTFNDVRRASMRLRARAAENSGDIARELHAIRDELEAERRMAEEFSDLATSETMLRRAAENDRRRLEEERAQLLAQIHGLNWRIRSLEEAFSRKGDGSDDSPPIPDTLQTIGSWAEEHLAGRVLLLPRAVRAAQGSPFEDVALVYESLLLLAGDFHRMRIGNDDAARERVCARLAELHLEDTPSGDRASILTHRNEFTVTFQGENHVLGRHLKKGGNSRDPRRCFRLYYFWHEDTQQVVVGHLPGHLTTQAS